MTELQFDIAVVGGGPAGMAAALEAAGGGASVVILERNYELGGILQQCIHDGFGLLRFGKSMPGNMYAQAFIDEIEKTPNITVYTDTMVLEITEDKELYACNTTGILHICAGAVILAMGCRERTAGQIQLMGYRPKGVLTAGAAQKYINIDGYLPGTRAVILGSGDIGLIMARRMSLEGIEVKGVYEVMPAPGGLTRNIVQCLEDYDIPLHLSHTVTKVHGLNTLEGVTVAALGADGKPVPGTEQYIECDLLVLSVGLIPENELSVKAGIKLDEKTRGPVLDENSMTEIPGIFACGNVSIVYDLVDYVSLSGENAARGALSYINEKGIKAKMTQTAAVIKKAAADVPATVVSCAAVLAGEGVNFAVPQKIHTEKETEVTFYLRVRRPVGRSVLSVLADGKEVLARKMTNAEPPSMLTCTAVIPEGVSEVTLTVKEVQ